MTHQQNNLRDIEFTLFEFLGTGAALGQGPYAELDEDPARAVLAEVERLASTDLAASFADADRHLPVLDRATGTVPLPPSLPGSTPPGCSWPWAISSSAGCCCARPASPSTRCPAPPGATGRSTRGRSPRRWFAANVLPGLAAQRALAEASDLSLMELDEAAF